MKHLARMLGFITIVVSVIGLAACTPGAAPTSVPSGAGATAPAVTPGVKPTAPATSLAPYKVVAIFAQTGPMSGPGIPLRDAIVTLAADINATGGINGRKLDLAVYDDESDDSKSFLALKKALETDKALVVVGPIGSGPVMGAIPVVEEARVPALVVASADSIVRPVKKWVFKLVSGEAEQVPPMYTYMKAKGVKKLALLLTKSPSAVGAGDFIKATASKEGFELVATEVYEPTDKDFLPQLTRIKAAGAQGVITWDATVTTALIARQMKAMDLNIPWTGTTGLASPGQVKAAGDAFDGLVLPTPKTYVWEQLPDTDAQKKAAQRRYDLVRKSTGKDPDPGGFAGWDALLMISEAIKRTNPDPDNLSDARAKVRDGIESLSNFPGLNSVYKMGPTDHMGYPPDALALVEIRGGKFSLWK